MVSSKTRGDRSVDFIPHWIAYNMLSSHTLFADVRLSNKCRTEDRRNVTDPKSESLAILPISIAEMLPSPPPALVRSSLPWILGT